MKKLIVWLVCAVLVFALTGCHSSQDFVFKKLIGIVASQTADLGEEDALNIFVCGSSSPLPSPDREQACIAVITHDRFFVIDSGQGSTKNLLRSRLPMNRLEGCLLYTSDAADE